MFAKEIAHHLTKCFEEAAFPPASGLETSSGLLSPDNVDCIASLYVYGAVCRSAERVLLAVFEHIGQGKEITPFNREATDTGVQLHAQSSRDAILELRFNIFAILVDDVIGTQTQISLTPLSTTVFRG